MPPESAPQADRPNGGQPGPPPARQDAPASRRIPTPGTVLAIASLGVFMAFVDATVVNIAIPDIERSFGDASIASVSWVLNAYNVVFAAFLVAAGRMADLLGRRRVFKLALVTFTLASLLCALAPSVQLLIAARVVQALGAALLVPASLALVLAAFEQRRRAHAVALWSACGALAAGIGPPLGGLLVSAGGWPLVFLVNIPVGIATFVLASRLLLESRTAGRRRLPDLVGACQAAGAIGLLTLAVVQGPEWGWTNPAVVGALVLSIAIATVLARRCRWHRDPLIDLGLLRLRSFAVANALAIMAAAGFFGYTLCNVLFLTSVWGYSVLDAGLALTPGPLVAVAVAGPASRLAERFGARTVIAPGALVWSAGVAFLLAKVGSAPDFVGEWLPAMVILGVGAGMAFPTLSGAAIDAAPGEQFATATALHSVARQVGAVLGIALVVALIGAPAPAEAAQAFDRAWTFSAACLGACGLGALALARGSVAGTVPSLASAARAVRAAPVCRPAAPRPAARMVRDASPRALAPPARDGREDPAEFLRRVAIFADLPHALRADIVRHATSRRVQAGSWLFRRGDPGDCLYIVRAGRLEVLVPDGDGLSQARVVGRGGVLGELALLEDVPRSACVRAVRDTDLMAISRERFLNLLLGRPQLGLALARALGAQLRDSSAVTSQVRALPGTIAIVALTPGVPVAALGERLVAAIGRHAPVSMLDGGEGEPDCSGEDRIAEWGPLLDRREHAGRHVVLVAGDVRQPDPWTRFCLQQADRILAVSTGGPVGEWVAGRAELHACELIGWDIAEGSGVLSAWADALAPEQTHLLRSGAALEAGVQRLARHVTGRAVGLVLSGGGARAFAHIGVLEELRAAGVTIDRVAGVSMGAYIGAMAAMGLDPAAIDARCHEEWVRRRPLSDYTVPRHAIIRGDRCRAMFRRTFGAIAIEELELGYFSASADLRSGELVVHRWGGLAEHVSTSMCLPGIAPPQVRGRRLLVDGGLVDNLPVTTMAALGDGPIIAVDVKATLPRPPREDREPRPPFIGETLMRSLVLGSANTTRTARRHADLVITPSAEGVGMLEFHQIDRAVEIGREAARAALADAPESLLG